MKRISKKSLVVGFVALAVLLAAGAGFVYWKKQHKSVAPLTPNAVTPTSSDTIPGPTEEEKQATEEHKDDVVKQQEIENNPSSGQKSVAPIITSASQGGASAYVSGIFEDGGTCTFTFTKGSLRITKSVGAFGNVSTTNCTNVSMSRSEFAEAGTWSLTVTYSSPKAQGTSQAKEFMVQ